AKLPDLRHDADAERVEPNSQDAPSAERKAQATWPRPKTCSGARNMQTRPGEPAVPWAAHPGAAKHVADKARTNTLKARAALRETAMAALLSIERCHRLF